MSIASLGGIFASTAGSTLAQTTGSDVERSRQDTADRQRQISSSQQAERTAGIAEADGQNHHSGDRDADGRRPWEIQRDRRAATSCAPADFLLDDNRQLDCGQSLDLIG